MLPNYSTNKISDNFFIIEIDALESTGAFDGHFPNCPILPGVIQLDWVMKLVKMFFPIVEPSAQNFQIKFSKIIRPGKINLHLKYTGAKIDFEYYVGEEKCSSGSIKILGRD